MSVHESSVNFQNLIRDLAEMYPFDVAEVVVVELVANALDAGATRIGINYDADRKILVVADNGKGMSEGQFDEYHDFAAGLKTRGSGIGFAGVGAKISFNIADRVVTETRSDSFSGGSNWHLQSRKKLIWEDLQPTHLVANGTRVEVYFTPESSPPFATTEDIVQLLRRHYLPLTDMDFLDLYQSLKYYPNSLRLTINGQMIVPGKVTADLALDKVRQIQPKRTGKRIGHGFLGLAENEYPLGPDCCGILLCTHGKVIKADFFNQFPGGLGPRIFGLVEVPGFIKFLTTNKSDFIRGRGMHREFESLYDPIRQEFKAWLAELGVEQMEATETDEVRKLERELQKLVDDIPELGEFFGFRTRKAVLSPSATGSVLANIHEGAEITLPQGEGEGRGEKAPLDVGDDPGQALVEDAGGGAERAEPISRTARRGPRISFVYAPERVDLAWVDGNNVVINSGHPSYMKVKSNLLAKRICDLFAIGTAVQRFMASGEGAQDPVFVDRLMASWGKK